VNACFMAGVILKFKSIQSMNLSLHLRSPIRVIVYTNKLVKLED
jgi:hypothetical protein